MLVLLFLFSTTLLPPSPPRGAIGRLTLLGLSQPPPLSCMLPMELPSVAGMYLEGLTLRGGKVLREGLTFGGIAHGGTGANDHYHYYYHYCDGQVWKRRRWKKNWQRK